MRTRITLACTECKQRNYNTTKGIRRHILTEWKQASTADSARSTQRTKKPNNQPDGQRGAGNGKFLK